MLISDYSVPNCKWDYITTNTTNNLMSNTINDILKKEVEVYTSATIKIDIESAIKKVIFNNPATVVYWIDNTKTVVKCGENDVWDPEKGLAMAIVKKLSGNKGNYNKIFNKYIPKEQKNQQSIKDKFMQMADEYVKSLMENADG